MKNGLIMDTSPIVKRKDEAKHCHYRTKTRILEIYDEMAEEMKGLASSETGKRDAETLPGYIPTSLSPSSLSHLHPPPGPPVDEKGNFIPIPARLPGQPKPSNWLPHIRLPKDVRHSSHQAIAGGGETQEPTL